VLNALEDTGLSIGQNVAAMEQRVAALFGKRCGVISNSESLLDLPKGSE
jgi:hypothetical protein